MAQRTVIVPVVMPDGSTIQVDATVEGPMGQNVGTELAALPMDGVLTSIEVISKTFSQTLEKVKPDKASIEFGIEIAVKEGSLTGVLVKGSATANLVITLTWGK
jgi:hypothetical protein